MEMVRSKELEKALVNDLVKQIVSVRKRLGITQRHLASLSGVARTNIVNIENRKQTPRLDQAIRLLAAMGSTLFVATIDKELDSNGELVNKFLYY